MTLKLTFLLVLNTLFCVAQHSEVTELDSINVWLQNHYKVSKDSTSIFKNAHKAIILSQKTNNQMALASAYGYLEFYHKTIGKLDSAFQYINKQKAIYSSLNDEDALAKTYIELKELYEIKADYDIATNTIFKALNLFEKTKNKKGIAQCYAHIGDLSYYTENYEKGVEWCDKAIKIQQELNAQEDLALSYRYKANNELFAGPDLKNALATINKSITIYKHLGEFGIPYMASINWRGNIYKYMENYEMAIADYQANYENSEKMGLERYLIPSLANIGHVYIMQGKYKEAIPYNLKAIELIKKTGRVRNLWENYMHVSDAYEAIGDYKSALYYYHLYNDTHESFMDNTIRGLETEAQAKYETGQKNATIVFQEEKIAQQQQTKTLYIILTGLLATILFGLLYNYKKRQKRNEVLQLLNAQLDSKNKQNELLLKEIHHRVKNNLELVKSLISLQSAQLEDSATKDAMIASQNRVQSMGIIHQKLYQGENLGSIEMKDYFINLGEGILDTFNAENKVKIECAMDNLELDIDTAVPIGLIVNELLTNALKYAFPKDTKGNIQISLSKPNPETLTLKVVDNGIGKTQGLAPKGTGFGSQLVMLLTQQLNGNMKEDNKNGTAISFNFKLNTAA
ncbi:MAG: histidine kinase dimerization/phosphoacceptor domain -containing protein [Gelidibacter sp.]